MRTVELTVDPDGRVTIPDTSPGQTVFIQIAEGPATPETGSSGPIPEEEREAIKERIMQRAREIRAELPKPRPSADHRDLLYGDEGLPK